MSKIDSHGDILLPGSFNLKQNGIKILEHHKPQIDLIMTDNTQPEVTTRASVTQGNKPIVPPNGNQKVKINVVRRGKK